MNRGRWILAAEIALVIAIVALLVATVVPALLYRGSANDGVKRQNQSSILTNGSVRTTFEAVRLRNGLTI
jgi:hypothetical protein